MRAIAGEKAIISNYAFHNCLGNAKSGEENNTPIDELCDHPSDQNEQSTPNSMAPFHPSKVPVTHPNAIVNKKQIVHQIF